MKFKLISISVLITVCLLNNVTFASAETIGTASPTMSTSTASTGTVNNVASSTTTNYNLLYATQTPPKSSIIKKTCDDKDLMKAGASDGGFVAEVYAYYIQSDKRMYTFLLYDHNNKDSSYGRYAELIDMPTDVTSLILPDSVTFNGYTYPIRDITLMSNDNYAITSLTVPDTLFHMFINPNVPNLKNINVPTVTDRAPDISCSTDYAMSQFNISKVSYSKDFCDKFRLIKPLTKKNAGSDYICAVEVGNYDYYLLNDGTAKVGWYESSAESSITIPSNVQFDNFNYLVTTIGSQAFKDDYPLNTIILPSSIKTLESYSFYNTKLPLTVLYRNPNLSTPSNPFNNSDLGTLTYQADPNEKSPSPIGVIKTPTATTATATGTTSTAKTGDVSSLPLVLTSLAGISGVGVFKKRK